MRVRLASDKYLELQYLSLPLTLVTKDWWATYISK